MPRHFGSLTQLRHLSNYLVGKGQTWGGLSDLKNLNRLEGELCISNLENIDNMKEAELAQLEDKKDLQELAFQWSVNTSINILKFQKEERHLEIAQRLRPPTHIGSISLFGYPGGRFPNWVSEENSFPSLHTVAVSGCVTVKSLNLPYKDLHRVQIQDCPQLESLNIGGTTSPVSVNELIILDCPNLKSFRENGPVIRRNLHIQGCDNLQISLETFVNEMLVDPSSTEQLDVQCKGIHFTLKQLRLVGNTHLASLPSKLWSFTFLRAVELVDCPLLESVDLAVLPFKITKFRIAAFPLLHDLECRCRWFSPTSLRSLQLHDLPKLVNLPCSAISPSLFKLKVTDCPIIEISHPKLPTTSLQVLHISGCPELRLITEEELPGNLEKLVVHDCQSLECLTRKGIHNLTNFQTLQLTDCEKLSLLSNAFQVLNSLKELRVDYLHLMKCLLSTTAFPPTLEKLKIWGDEIIRSFPHHEWLQNLPCLQRLKIAEFPQLQSLPKRLPSSLRRLSICDCPALTILPQDIINLNSLKKLKMMNCELSDSFGESGLPSMLVELKIINCQNLKYIPNLHTLTCLESINLDLPRVEASV